MARAAREALTHPAKQPRRLIAAAAFRGGIGDHERGRERHENAHERHAQIDERDEAEVAEHPYIRERQHAEAGDRRDT